MRFPILAVERTRHERRRVDAGEAAHVDVDLVGVRARDVKGVNAAVTTEGVFGDARIEAVRRELVAPGMKLERAALDDQVQKALLFADRAVAHHAAGELAAHRETHAPAVAAAFVTLHHAHDVARAPRLSAARGRSSP